MNDYDITIKFKSKGTKADYIDDNDIIYKFIRENFWNISNYSYDFKIAKAAFEAVDKRKWQKAIKLSKKANDKSVFKLIFWLYLIPIFF